MRNRRKGIRPLAWLLSVAMIITLMPSMVFAADSQDHPVWKDGVYQETARGFGGDVTVEITIENGKIISATSPTHNGESFWDLQNVNQMLDDIVTYQKADVDIATGATYSSNAVINAAKVALEAAAKAAEAETPVDAPATIKSVSDLEKFAKAVDGGNTYEGQTVTLEKDLDLSEITNWNPIGSENGTVNVFNGTFDGRNKTISGMKHSGSYGEEANIGLFSTLGSSAVVKNLKMTGTSIEISAESGTNPRLRAGSVAGDTQAGSPIVDTVTVNGSISVTTETSMGMAGGILGRMSRGASLTNSVADVTVNASYTGDWGNAYAGGLTAMTGNSCFVANSAAVGKVSGMTYEAGAAGMMTGGVYNVYTDVTLSGKGENSGSVAGQTMASGDYVYYTGDEAFGTVTLGEVTTTPVSSTGESLADTLNLNLDKITSPVELKSWSVGEKGYAVPDVESDDSVYVLMNIPYADFYEAENGAVDTITSATKNGKARNINVNGASYHQGEAAVTEEGIAGAMYPVKVSDLNDLKSLGGREVTDEDTLSYEMSSRGQTTTVTLNGAEVLQESPSYSYYYLNDIPASYKELTVSDGKASFGEATGTPITGVATGEASIGGRHADIEIPLSGVEVEPKEVSAVVITTDSGSYALHHVVNIWRGTEIGWNLSDMDLGGQKINRIRYFMKDGSIKDYTTEIPIASAAYVLMNIPYADFYKAELSENDPAVDTVSSATKSKPKNSGLAGGSYHKNADGSDISGVIYPVFVKDMSQLEGLTEITDESSVDVTVNNRGTETTTTYSGKDALFESADYSYYKLNEKPARYKTMTVEDGVKSFGAVSGRATTVEGASGAVNEAGHHAEVEIKLSDTAGIEQGQAVSGVVVTFDDDSKAGLRHIAELWRATEIGGSAAQFADKKITNVRYYTQDSVIDFPMEISVKKKAAAATAEFTDTNTIQMTGLPEDLENAKATVQTKVGRGETATVIAEDVEVNNGVITTTDAAESGNTYSIMISSDNYLRISAEAVYEDPSGKDSLSGLIGEYQPLFDGATLNSEYDHYWHDYTSAVVGESAADGMVDYMKTSINAKGYGENKDEPNFYCSFPDDVATISFGGDDGKTVTFTRKDGSSITHTYAFVREAAATGKYGDYDMSMSGNLFKAQETTGDEFRYLLMFPDTPDTTYHLEFRYAGTEEDVLNLLEGPYAYCVASAIQTSALTEEDEDTIQKVLSLFIVENMAENESEETDTQRQGLAGTWDCDFSDYPEYGNAEMYIVLSADGSGKTYADFTGNGEPALVSEYTFFAYDPDKSDGKDAGTYIALNPEEETVTPGEYEIKQINGKKALVFTSNEGMITYYFRDNQYRFKDVDTSLWYFEGIDYAVNNGLMKGISDDLFAPNDTTTRAMIVTILYRLEGEPAAEASSFKDVKAGSWYEAAVNWAAANGIVNGYNEDTFAPTDEITREQMATILYRYARFKGKDVSQTADLSNFTDAGSISGWAKDAVAWAVEVKLINGMTDTTLVPQGSATRAQAATLMMRLCENVLK